MTPQPTDRQVVSVVAAPGRTGTLGLRVDQVRLCLVGCLSSAE
jgi:hypothetical protein